jgi:hypothetical protein
MTPARVPAAVAVSTGWTPAMAATVVNALVAEEADQSMECSPQAQPVRVEMASS